MPEREEPVSRWSVLRCPGCGSIGSSAGDQPSHTWGCPQPAAEQIEVCPVDIAAGRLLLVEGMEERAEQAEDQLQAALSERSVLEALAQWMEDAAISLGGSAEAAKRAPETRDAGFAMEGEASAFRAAAEMVRAGEPPQEGREE